MQPKAGHCPQWLPWKRSHLFKWILNYETEELQASVQAICPLVGGLYNDKGKMSNTRGDGECLDPSGNRKASRSLGCRPENPYGTENSMEWANFLGNYPVLNTTGQVWTGNFVNILAWLDPHLPRKGVLRGQGRTGDSSAGGPTAAKLLLHLWDWCRKGSALCGSMPRLTPVTHMKNKNKVIDNLGGNLFYQVQ